MSTIIEKLKTKENRHLYNSVYFYNLMQGLDNRPEDWKWEGNVLYDKKGTSCICGHPINYMFPLHDKKTGKIVIVGCVCVENYKLFDSSIIEKMKGELKKIRSELQKKKAEAKKLIQKKEIEDLIRERNPLLDQLNKLERLYRETNTYMPYDLYKYNPVNPEKYVRLTASIKALKKDINKIKPIYEKYKDQIPVLEEKIRIMEENDRIWQKEQEEEEKRIANLKHIGEIGERIELKVKLIESTLNRNYDTWFYKFEDGDRNVIVKWGLLTSIDFQIDHIYSFSAIVKKHKEWNDIKSTVITRLKDIKEVIK